MATAYERWAAHYLARHQDTEAETRHWNQRALDAALSIDTRAMATMMPSLHLNLGRSHEDAGQHGLARHHYRQAADASHVLGDDGYSQMTRNGIAAALERTAAFTEATGSEAGDPQPGVRAVSLVDRDQDGRERLERTSEP